MPTATATSSTTSEAGYACPTAQLAAASKVPAPRIGDADAPSRSARAGRRGATGSPDRLEVTYDLATAAAPAARAAFAARETAVHARLVREIDFPHAGLATRVLSVDPALRAAAQTALLRSPGVRSVTVGANARYPQTVTQPYFTNDPYFWGFIQTSAPTATATPPPATYEVGPYEEGQRVPGQWNMHAIGLDDAFAYSQGANGSSVANGNARGNAAVKIAIVDTGEDATHPELQSKIAYQRCFITDPTGVRSTSAFAVDEDGHGTDTAGLAAAASDNALGFAGAGGDSSIYAYRVQATPDDDCTNTKTTDSQCSAETADIADAILDAVAQHVNVISISLGGGACVGGQDPDSVEGNAVKDAIAANVIVVASSGNDGSAGVAAPACDPGVIAVGASSLADGQPDGSGFVAGTPSAPVEYVASYSDYGIPSSAPGSGSAWGIVAPGGDPNGATDGDYFHWIEDIWTSTPFDANFAGDCSPDYPGNANQTGDCRELIAGTSMSAPTLAGAAALIIAVAPAYQSPAKMKSLLCTTAQDIGDAREGCGRLDVYRAMAVALGDPKLP